MQTEYLTLWTAITNAIDALDTMRAALIAAQQQAEEQYIVKEAGG